MSDRKICPVSFAEAARRYCEARDADRVLRLGMRACDVEEEAEATDPDSGYWNHGVAACWRSMPVQDEQWDPSTDWCPSCLNNLAIIEQSRKLRAPLGGLASSMMSAYRREHPSGEPYPDPAGEGE